MKNLILSTDSYKFSHKYQYPPGTEYVSAYIEARGGETESVFFGLQAFLKENLVGPVIKKWMVDEAAEITTAHGVPFYREDWDVIVKEFGGKLPISISAVPEGSVLATSNVQVQITNTDPRFFWLPSFLETMLLRGVWYPSTVATKSRALKKIILNGLSKTSDLNPEETVLFKLHDFGARGASSSETAALGGMAHLVNFMGTDTVEGLMAARNYYSAPMAGFSIPASEHSTITSWGKENESKAYENMIDLFSGPGKLYACVSDSYSISNAVSNIWGKELKDKVLSSGGTLVVRPDSGEVTTAPLEVIQGLFDTFGFEVNSKGYKVLPPSIRVIQGDGITETTLPILIQNCIEAGISLDNIAFGMGGGLLQAWTRDTLRYAMKTSAICINGIWSDVFKDPEGDHSKKSKAGRLALVQSNGLGSVGVKTIREEFLGIQTNMLQPVFRDGVLLVDQSFDEIRARAKVYVEAPAEGMYE